MPLAPLLQQAEGDYWKRLNSYPKVGFSICPQLHEWRQRFPPRIVTLVSNAPLELTQPLMPQHRRPETRFHDPRQMDFYLFDIQRRCLIGAIEPLPSPPPVPIEKLWFSTEHLVPKSSDLPFRTVFNGHAISQHLHVPPTRLKGLPWFFANLPRNGWIYRFDLKDAFYALLVRPGDRRLQCFIFQQMIYWYRAHSQGISPSGSHLCEVTTAMGDYWATIPIADEVIQVGAYFDDLNGFASLYSTAILHSAFVAKEIATLGFFLSSKSQPTPAQRSIILGYELDTCSLTARLPQAKLLRLENQMRLCLRQKSISAREALSLAGRLMDARFASSLFRAAAYALYPHISSSSDWDTLAPISSEIKDRLRYLLHELPRLNGRPFRYDSSAAVQLVTDASSTGWTAVIMSGPHAGKTAQGRWTAEVIQACHPFSHHINYLELLTIYLGLEALMSYLRGQTVWCKLDSFVALVYVLKAGGPVEYLRAGSWRLHCLALQNGIYLTPPRLLPSLHNPADHGTRHTETDSVRIARRSFEKIALQWGPFSIDLFANSTNAISQTYFAPAPTGEETRDEGAAAFDALHQSWQGITRAWIFPPPDLLEDVLHKLFAEQPQGVLIVPCLPNSRWWPLYRQLSGDTWRLQTSDFKVDGLPTSSIFLSLTTHFEALLIRWPR